ncbi:hypothetical protein [Algivirga pacifica]|uniref:DUF4397 domain-containing protein n=1 Tax=Algivirga pacifica TaxID=1162670 RepID=A0ABP9D7Y9_9BACT
MNIKYFFLLAIISGLLFSCGEYNDDTPPTLEDFRVNNSTENAVIDELDITDALIISGFFQDDLALYSYTLSVNPLGDTPDNFQYPSLISFDTTFFIGGAQTKIFREIALGSNQIASGNYQLTINFEDDAENQGIPQSIDFEVINQAPSISLFNFPFGEDTIFIPAGEFTLEGNLDDRDKNLSSIGVVLLERTFNPEEINPDSAFIEEVIDVRTITVEGTPQGFSELYTLSPNGPNQTYSFLIRGTDSTALSNQVTVSVIAE